MKNIGLNELREMYLEFFESKNHLRMPSFSLIPKNDPSILFINAGMTPLKPYFTGAQKPPSNRVTTCQKCMRTPDIDYVGVDSRHGTFFEMLGNFSFGDYFKIEAIEWAWEFFTKVLEMPIDKLYVTVYEEDDEAYDIWTKTIGLTQDKVVRLGKEENFWEHGVGPCGPCSEIHYDRGEKYSCGKSDCMVGCDCDRYVEIWNLVFTQFNRLEDGSYVPLDKKNIDTGMGLERIAYIIQEAENMFEVDTIQNIIKVVSKITKKKYGENAKEDISTRIITDHVRGAIHLISDGVVPNNEGSGYVLRRLIRRAARHGRLLGIKKSFLEEIANIAIDESKQGYPMLLEKKEYIVKILKMEEEKFQDTVEQGLTLLNGIINNVKKEKTDTIPGEVVFKLHDTYGFPIDLTREIAIENELKIDEEGFKKAMKIQKDNARQAYLNKEGSAWETPSDEMFNDISATEFVGYDSIESESNIIKIIHKNEFVNELNEGYEGTIILKETPFYAESGGQVGDSGTIETEAFSFMVKDCKKTSSNIFLHHGFLTKGKIEVGEKVKCIVDKKRRKAIARNHTTTHLLQKALKDVLGQHITQAGSYVDSKRLRFDFHHFTAMTKAEIEKVEKQVNEAILTDFKVNTIESTVKEAKEKGATALFDEKYGDIVRVIDIEKYSIELCGGTHLASTAQAGTFKILSESGVAAGVRRIEGITGYNSIKYIKENEKIINELNTTLKTNSKDLNNKVKDMVTEVKTIRKEIEQMKNKMASGNIDEIISSAIDLDGLKLCTARMDQLDNQGLRNLADTIKNKVENSVIVLLSAKDNKVSLVVSASKIAIDKGIHSGNAIREISALVGGKGGGRADMAQAGGKDISKIDFALNEVPNIFKKQLK